MGNFKKERITNCANFNENVDNYGHKLIELIKTLEPTEITSTKTTFEIGYNLFEKYGKSIFIFELVSDDNYDHSSVFIYLRSIDKSSGVLSDYDKPVTVATEGTFIEVFTQLYQDHRMNIYKINI